MPNEIFEDLNTNIENVNHRAFAYCYYYYVTYLYRYCKYQADQKNTQADIKQFLGYSPVQKKVDYIIKKDGVLDLIGYTLTTTNYPVNWYVDENHLLRFDTISEVKSKATIPIISDRNFKVKYPLKCFHRTDESEKECIIDGTFFEVSNTHLIDFDSFKFMMGCEDLGVNAMYICAYLKYKNDKFEKYQVSFSNLAKELDISKTTLAKYIEKLEDHGFLKIYHQKFEKGKNGEANIYYVKI
jgi:hypothetical protein